MLNEPLLDMEAVLRDVASTYSLEIRHAEFVPKGEVAWCYKLTDREDRAFLLRIAPGASKVLVTTLEKLRGLDFVITPVDNLIFERDGYSLSLYKFVAGETMWERTPNVVQMEGTGRSFAQLHQTVHTEGPFERQEIFAIEFADEFQSCIERLTVGNATGASHKASLRKNTRPFRLLYS